jgi:hypothetical protein
MQQDEVVVLIYYSLQPRLCLVMTRSVVEDDDNVLALVVSLKRVQVLNCSIDALGEVSVDIHLYTSSLKSIQDQAILCRDRTLELQVTALE